MKPIDLMHHKFGSGCEVNKCGTCCNIRGYIYGNHSVRKCLAYGGLHSSKADWAKKWTACGLYGKKITRQMVSDTEKSMFFRGLKQKEAEGPMKGQLILEALKDVSTPIDGTWSKFVWNLSKSESLARKFRDGKACLIDLRLAVEAQPTLTQPNETPPCYQPDGDGCAYQCYDGDDEPIDKCKECPLCYSDKQRHHAPPNEPLTLEQLREMNGGPVYIIVDDGHEPLEMWALIDVPEKDHIVLTNNIGGRSAYYSDDDLERDHITVYRRPPEGEANE